MVRIGGGGNEHEGEAVAIGVRPGGGVVVGEIADGAGAGTGQEDVFAVVAEIAGVGAGNGDAGGAVALIEGGGILYDDDFRAGGEERIVRESEGETCNETDAGE